jgi:hypothetical protein
MGAFCYLRRDKYLLCLGGVDQTQQAKEANRPYVLRQDTALERTVGRGSDSVHIREGELEKGVGGKIVLASNVSPTKSPTSPVAYNIVKSIVQPPNPAADNGTDTSGSKYDDTSNEGAQPRLPVVAQTRMVERISSSSAKQSDDASSKFVIITTYHVISKLICFK